MFKPPPRLLITTINQTTFHSSRHQSAVGVFDDEIGHVLSFFGIALHAGFHAMNTLITAGAILRTAYPLAVADDHVGADRGHKRLSSSIHPLLPF